MSPRLKGIVCIHLRTIPIIGKGLQPGAQIGCLSLADAPGPQFDSRVGKKCDDYSRFLDIGRLLEKLDLAISIHAFDGFQHVVTSSYAAMSGTISFGMIGRIFL
jgi:hypothetical protein